MSEKISENLPEGESLIFAGYANRIGFWGGPGGKLLLTNRRMLFTNRREKKVLNEYLLSDVLYVSDASSATIWTAFLLVTLFLKNAIKITLKNQTTQRFVVSDKQRWISLIDEERRAVKAEEGSKQ